MCGRFTRNYTWEQIHALYRLTAPTAIPNLQNACPTDPADTIVEHAGKRAEMRWGTVLVKQAAQEVGASRPSMHASRP
jgi:putative SOS response-associated peptidase YedK